MKAKFSRRDFMRASILSASGAFLAACAPATPKATDAPPSEAATEAPPEPTVSDAPPAVVPGTISMWGWWDIRMAIYEEAAQGFMQENPGVKIKVEDVAEMQRKVNAAVAAGTGPTLLKQDSDFYFNMRAQGILIPYPEELFPDSWFAETYPNFDLKNYGRYVVPTGSTPFVLIYNKAHFAEVGLDPEVPPTTWAELIEMGKKLTKVDASGTFTRMGYINDQYYAELPLIFQEGADIMKREGEKRLSVFNSDEVKAAYEFHTGLALKDKIWDPTLTDNIEAFGTGNAAMTGGYTWVLGEYKANYPDVYKDIGLAAPPTPTGKAEPVYGYRSPTLDFSVLKGHPEEYETAFKFLKYMYDQRGDIIFKLVDLMALAPENIHVINDPKVKGDATLQKMIAIAKQEHDPLQSGGDLDALMKNTRDQVILAGMSVSDACDLGHEELQKLIDAGLFDYYIPIYDKFS
jgi:ABC-type glycerol-3-phosphate transport system substrate-binding protein